MYVYGGVCRLWGCKYKGGLQFSFTERMAQREPIYINQKFSISLSRWKGLDYFPDQRHILSFKKHTFCPINGNSRYSDTTVILQRKYYTCFSLLTIQLQPHRYCYAGDLLLILSQEIVWDVNIKWWNPSLEHAKINISMPSNLRFRIQARNSSIAQYSFQKIECSREKRCVSVADFQSLSVSLLWATSISVPPQISPWSMMTVAKSEGKISKTLSACLSNSQRQYQ